MAAAPAPGSATEDAESLRGEAIAIRRASGPIAVDGDLSDPAWRDAARVEVWYETNPGDNLEPKVKNLGYLAHDERFFYAAFEFADPEPGKIRAAYADRDNLPGDTDYAGVILDTRNDGKTAQMFLANPRGIQYDALTSDVSGEDSSPDFFWDSAARVTPQGWVLELRIPFSSLRYEGAGPHTWGILLYRNYPRDYRYQHFSARLPRGGNCFICRANTLTGLEGLPTGGHLVVAPYATASQADRPRGEVGTPLDAGDPTGELGVDAKWNPNADMTLDLTFNPDFSQVESDVAQIAANERFALFFPEKRPFFLEGIDLFSTTLQALHTRTITSPRWGGRATGTRGDTAYTLLVAEDRGGGSVVLPGPDASGLADQDFSSRVLVTRVRHDLGRSYVSLLGSAREIEGGGYNRVVGPDFQWRPTERDTITGQVLFSRSETPERPDLADEWDGRSLSGFAAQLWWAHSTRTVDWTAFYTDRDDEFRADNGFVAQVGIRDFFGEVGYTFRPQGFLRRLRTFAVFDRTEDRDGELVFGQFYPGVGMDGKWNSFWRFWYAWEEVRSGGRALPRRRLNFVLQASPTRAVSNLSLEGWVGEEIDFAHSRVGEGANLVAGGTLRPTDHLELRLDGSRRWLDVDRPGAAGAPGDSGRLFTAQVARLRATYTFSARSYLRAIVQQVETDRDPALFDDSEVPPEDEFVSGSLLFAYKLNWQTVLFVGAGENRELAAADPGGEGRGDLEPSGRQFFLKLSYAFQR